MRLHRVVEHDLRAELRLDDHVGLGKALLVVAARALARLAEQRALAHRLVGIEQRLEHLELARDRTQRRACLRERVRADGGDRLSLVRAVGGQLLDVARPDRRVHARHRERRCEVDARDPRARVRRAQDRRVQHPGLREVGGVDRLPGCALAAVDAQRVAADDLERACGPLVERVLLDDEPDLLVPALDLFLGADQPCHVRIASSIFGYAPQRHRFPAMACRISSVVGAGVDSTSATALTICPGVQNPHWSASAAHERVDHRVLAKAFDRRHARALDRMDERDAREHRLAVDEHGARAAVALTARDLRAGERQLLAERLGERRADLGVHVVAVVVDSQLHVIASICAMCTSRWVRRIVCRASTSSSISGTVAHRSRAASSSSRIPSTVFAVPVALRAGVDRKPEHADLVGLARPEQRRRHREVLRGCARAAAASRACRCPTGSVGSGSSAPSASAFALPASIARSWSSSYPARRAVFTESSKRRRLLPVRIVARVDAPARAGSGGRSRAGRSGSRSTCRRRRPCGRAMHAARPPGRRCPAWAMISVASGLRSTRRASPAAIGGRPRPRVDQDRHAPLGGELEHRAEPLVGRVELLRARVELDPSRAGVEAARRLLDRRLVQVEADERDQPAVRALRERERAVVRGAERRVAVGLVEAEHEGPRDPVVVHQLEQLVVVADHAVDVVPEVEVGVEDVGAGRQQPPELLGATGRPARAPWRARPLESHS